jgi:TonB family protein
VPTDFFEQCIPNDLLTALSHECAHLKRRDFQKNLFYEAVSLLIAFHPVTWILKGQIAQTREMICDALAIEKLIDSQSYAQSLLRLAAMIVNASPTLNSHAIGIFDANILEKRIMQIKLRKQNIGLVAQYGLTIAGTLLLGTVAAGAGTMALPIGTQSPAVAESQNSFSGQNQADLACTYYDPQGQGYPGTCGVQAGNKEQYFCTANENKELSQEQTGCESKVKRAVNSTSALQPGPTIYHVGGDVSAPKVISYKDPEYPESARKGKNKLQGVCVLELVVDTSGMPENVQVVRSLRSDFDVKAIDAVRQYRFTPALRDGVPVPVEVNIEVNFKLY